MHFRGHSCVNLEAVIERVWRCTGRPWLCHLRGRNPVNVEIHLEARIKRVLRGIWIPWLCEIGPVVGGNWQMACQVLRLYSSVNSLSTVGMWQCDFTFKLTWRAGWWWSIKWGGTPESQATFSGQLLIMRMKGRQTILGGCCTRCMLHLVNAVLSV